MASTSTTTTHSQIEITNAFDELAPPSASASSSATSFDVFINHRGPDVKHTLARAMYSALHATGLRVFLDSEELQLGDFLPAALEAAMGSASLHVAIFSPTYAESPWCLAELSFMLKSGATIIPVFYNVQPTDLRWVAENKGLYAKSFLEHHQKGRYRLQKLEEWKMALYNISFNKGEIINNTEYNCNHKVEEDSASWVLAIKVKHGDRSNVKWREDNCLVIGLNYLLNKFRSYCCARSALKQLA